MPEWTPGKPEHQEGVVTEEKQQVKKPPLYKVLLHNDDYTTQDFVVFVLRTVFHKPPLEAERIMLAVHRQGIGIAGVFTYEIADTKVNKVISLARAREFPLLCTMEEE
jgi:ATP-dependent Clp protease adaptor protein ClpS